MPPIWFDLSAFLSWRLVEIMGTHSYCKKTKWVSAPRTVAGLCSPDRAASCSECWWVWPRITDAATRLRPFNARCADSISFNHPIRPRKLQAPNRILLKLPQRGQSSPDSATLANSPRFPRIPWFIRCLPPPSCSPPPPATCCTVTSCRFLCDTHWLWARHCAVVTREKVFGATGQNAC